MAPAVSAPGSELQSLLRPTSVAIVGASDTTGSISGRIYPVLRAHGYTGDVYLVNRHRDTVASERAYPSVRALPSAPELALIVVPAAVVYDTVRDCQEAGIKVVVVHSSGFSETEGGRNEAARLRELISRASIRLLGPNSEGLIDSTIPIALGFSPVLDPSRRTRELTAGSAVVLSQSGSVGFSLADTLSCAGIGVRAVVSTGNELDLEIADFLEYYGLQPGIGPITLFLEGLSDPARFLRVCRDTTARGVRVIVLRVGASEPGWRTSRSHSGKLTTDRDISSSLFAAAGAIEVNTTDELLDVLTSPPVQLPADPSIAVVGGSGGGCIWLADRLTDRRLAVPELSNTLQASLRAVATEYAVVENPIDLTAQVVYDGSLPRATELLLASPEVDVVAIVAGFGYSRWLTDDAALGKLLAERSKPVVAFSYNPPSVEAAEFFRAYGIPAFTDADRLARFITNWASSREPAAESRPLRRTAVSNEAEARKFFASRGVAFNLSLIVSNNAGLTDALHVTGYPVVLKFATVGGEHKADLGGVRLNLVDEAAARRAAAELWERGRPLGYTQLRVERQLRGYEALVGALNHPQLGPVVVIGRGGTEAEIEEDTLHRLAPISDRQVRAALRKLRGAAGWRKGAHGLPPADLDAFVELVERFSVAVCELDPSCWREVECNPVLLDDAGATAVDFRFIPRGAG